MAIMAVNTLQKDCEDDDPTIRGLALRSLCSLKIPNLVEYLERAIERGINDPNGYVRKTSVICCIKLYHISPGTVLKRAQGEEGEIRGRRKEDGGPESPTINRLYALLYDGDPQVVTNAIHALNEIMAGEGGLEVTKPLITSLLNRIKSFNEFGQCAVLNLTQSYQPDSESEMFAIMNILESRLKHSSPGVVLACVRCFLELTNANPDLRKQVICRVKTPLVTLMSTTPCEMSYTVLMHIRLLMHHPELVETLQDEFKTFFCRYSDPSYIQTVKIDILEGLAVDSTVLLILNELGEYVSDVQRGIGRHAIRAIGKIGMRIQTAVDYVVDQLLVFMTLEQDYVTTATLVVIRDLLRKYPRIFSLVGGVLEKAGSCVTETEGVAALIWIFAHAAHSPCVIHLY
eukprot:GHVN01057072.1.p1 GENE.GHVN01057072.1~~GHVN01057072.1.p1  ORF type:complete len:401 (+),score=57.82 GHVN01057072.1:243-1445(+)